jgi:hypothetical protein
MRDSRRWYRPGTSGGISPPQADRCAVCRRSRPSGKRGKVGCVGAARCAAHRLAPPVDQRAGGLVDVQLRGAVQAPQYGRGGHRDHPDPVSVGVDHAPASTHPAAVGACPLSAAAGWARCAAR